MLNKSNNQIDDKLPLPIESLQNYVLNLFSPIDIGECVTTVWVASAGRRVVNKFILENINLFTSTQNNLENYNLVYIEPLELLEESLEGYLKLIGLTFLDSAKRLGIGDLYNEKDYIPFNSSDITYPNLLNSITELIRKSINKGIETVLFLGEFDELTFIDKRFCNNLRALWNKFDGKLHYIFLIKYINLLFDKNKLGEDLAENFLQNVIYFPISNKNSLFLLNKFSKKFNLKLEKTEFESLEKLVDGHPYFLKVACTCMAKNKNSNQESFSKLLRNNYELRAVAKTILECQTEIGRKFLLRVSTEKVSQLSNDDEEILEKLGLIKQNSVGVYEPFCQIFKDAILEKSLPENNFYLNSESLLFNSELGTITFSGNPIEEKLTPQEYEILSSLLKEPNKLKTRDDIGDILWGKDQFDKYSDWAIDQLISKLRKKMQKIGIIKEKLVTIRGKGYKLVI
jgi:DNA-binding winged helix-turn-helix (wHTH) protein